jgi:glycosyltransferase involved in cell wall biosynthesis
MKKDFVVTVIVPVFNQEKFIGRCLRSLLGQNFKKRNSKLLR